MNKEIELTAKLSKSDYERIKKHFEASFRKTTSQKRFMLRFAKEKANVRESLDIRYKWTNGNNELVLKKGALGTQSRQETIVNLGKENQIEHFVQLFRLLGYKTLIAIYREIDRFEAKNLDVGLVSGLPYYFLEVEATEAKSKKEALDRVLDFFQEINLKPLNRADYQTFQRLFDRNVNLIFPIEQFPKPLLQDQKWKIIVEETVFSS